jgi:hypothetical protein
MITQSDIHTQVSGVQPTPIESTGPRKPSRIVRNITVSNTVLFEVRLGVHNHLAIHSLDDTLLTPGSSAGYSQTQLVELIDAGTPIVLDDDTAETISLQAKTLGAARVRIVTW